MTYDRARGRGGSCRLEEQRLLVAAQLAVTVGEERMLCENE